MFKCAHIYMHACVCVCACAHIAIYNQAGSQMKSLLFEMIMQLQLESVSVISEITSTSN